MAVNNNSTRRQRRVDWDLEEGILSIANKPVLPEVNETDNTVPKRSVDGVFVDSLISDDGERIKIGEGYNLADPVKAQLSVSGRSDLAFVKTLSIEGMLSYLGDMQADILRLTNTDNSQLMNITSEPLTMARTVAFPDDSGEIVISKSMLFTPSFPGATVSSASGMWYRQGRKVTVMLFASFGANSGSSQLVMSNLPFTIPNSQYMQPTGRGFKGTNAPLWGYGEIGTTSVYFTNVTGGVFTMTLANASSINFQIEYLI